MIPRGVGLFFFFCVPFSVFVTGLSGSDVPAGDYSNDGCDGFRQGYFDHYKCTLQCFNDVYQLRYIYGNMCEGTVEMDSNNWGAVPFPKIIQCMECITIRCRQSIPQSVCDGSFTVSNNNYGQSWSWKENYGDKYVNNQNQAQANTQPDGSLSNRNYWYAGGAPSSNTGGQNYQSQTNNQPGSSLSNQNYWYGGGVPSSNTGGQNYQSQMNFQRGSYPNRNFWYGNRWNVPSSNNGGGTSNQGYLYQANAQSNSQFNQNGWFGNGGDSGSSEKQTSVENYNSYVSSQQDVNGDPSSGNYDAPIANIKSSGKTSQPKPTKPPKPTTASKTIDKYSSLLLKKLQKDKSINAPSDSYDLYYIYYEDYGNTDNGSGDNDNDDGDNGSGDSTQENVSDSNNSGASTPSGTDSGDYVSKTGLQTSYGDGNGYATSTQSTDGNGDDYYDDDDYYYDYYYDNYYDDFDNQTITSPVSTATENTGDQSTESTAKTGSTEAITDNVPTTTQNPSNSQSTKSDNYSNSQTESTNDGNTSPKYSTEAPIESATSTAYDYNAAYSEYEAAGNTDSENTSARTLETSSDISQTTSSSVSVYSNSYYESDDISSTQDSKTVTDIYVTPSSTSNYPDDNSYNDDDYYYYYYIYYDEDDDDTSSISSTSNGYDNTKINSFSTKNTDDDSNKQSQDTDSNSSNDYSKANYQGNNDNNQYQWNQAPGEPSNSNTGPGTNKNLSSQSNTYNNYFYAPPQDNTRFRSWNPSYINNNAPSSNSYQNRFLPFNNRNTGSNIGNQPDKSYNPSDNDYQRNFNFQNQNVPVQGPSKNWNVNPATNYQQPSWQGNGVQYPNNDASTATGQSSAVQNNQGTGNGQAKLPRWNFASLFNKPLQNTQVASSNQNLGSPGIGESSLWNGNWQTQFPDGNPSYIKPENSQSQANGGFSAISNPGFSNVGSGAAASQQPSWSGNSQLPSYNQWSLQNQQGQQAVYDGSASNIENKESFIKFGDDKLVFNPGGGISFIKGDRKIEDFPLLK